MPEDLAAAISAAVGGAKSEVEGTPEPEAAPEKTETAPTTEKVAEKPAVEKAEPDKPEAKAEPAKKDEPADDDFWTPTAEELSAIDKNPELKKVYRSMQRGLTQKAQSLAELRKGSEEKIRLADWIQSEPDKAARAIAAASGLTLKEAKEADSEKDVVDALEEKWSKTVGPDAAKLLRPLFEETAQSMFQKIVGPVKEATEALSRAAEERGIAASVREFGASVVERGEEWDDDLQREMSVLSNTMQPGQDENGNPVSIQDYLSALHDAVVARRSRAKGAKTNLERLRRVKAESEPNAPTRTAPKTEDRPDLKAPIKDQVAWAVEQARKQAAVR